MVGGLKVLGLSVSNLGFGRNLGFGVLWVFRGLRGLRIESVLGFGVSQVMTGPKSKTKSPKPLNPEP